MDKIIDNLYLGNAHEAMKIFDNLGNFVACLSIGLEFMDAPQFKEIFPIERDWNHMIIGLNDCSNDLPRFIDKGVSFIADNINDGDVFVHCFAGISRSPSMIFAYLLSTGMKPYKAYKLIKKRRPIIDPYDIFLRDVLVWNKYNKIDSFFEKIKEL